MKNIFKIILSSVILVGVNVSNVWALELDDAVRTVPLNATKNVHLSYKLAKIFLMHINYRRGSHYKIYLWNITS